VRWRDYLQKDQVEECILCIVCGIIRLSHVSKWHIWNNHGMMCWKCVESAIKHQPGMLVLGLASLGLGLSHRGLTLHLHASLSCSKRTWMNYQYWVLYSIQYFGTNNQYPQYPLYELEQFALLRPLFQRILCVPIVICSSRAHFSQSGLVMHPHRLRVSDSVLEMLMFLKCN